jgi:hypothetical protein
MTGSSGKIKEISLGDDFGDVAVKVNGVLQKSNGKDPLCSAATNFIGITNLPCQSARSFNSRHGVKIMKKTGLIAAFALAALGSMTGCVDGEVYAGVSPDTHKPLYTTVSDAPGVYSWDKAMEYCGALQAAGHHDWRVPTKGELNMEFNNRTAIGGFNLSGSGPAGWYRSSSQDVDNGAWAQRFSDGGQYNDFKGLVSSLRCVR